MSRSLAVAGVAALVAAGCGSSSGDFVVLAASSLTDVVPVLTDQYELDHDPLDPVIDVAGSNALATQVIEGRAANVLMTADEVSMGRAVDAAAVTGPPTVFARNRLVIVVPPGNPGQVQGVADLADDGRLVAVCAPSVPCGSLTATVADRLGVVIAADTLDPSVRSVLTRVQTGSVDAGIVYVTDALAAGDSVDTVALPSAADATTAYMAAAIDADDEQAVAFVRWLTSEPAQQTLAAAGFERP